MLPIPLFQLWLPILLAALCVFLASSLIHMVVKWHASDYQSLPNEEEVRAALRKGSPAPGQYVLPHCADMKDMAGAAMQQKYQEGPVGMLTLSPTGQPAVGPALAKWFLFTLLVAFMAAYVASRSLAPGTHYLRVFRLVSVVSFLTYGFGGIPNAIWMGKPWRSVAKDLVDSLLYGLLSGGVFGWLWPHA